MDASPAPEYIAECLWPGVTRSDVAELETRAAASAATTAAGAEAVRYLGSVLLPADEVVFCFFSGPSSTAVEAVARAAGIPFERVLESVRVGERQTDAVDDRGAS